MKNWGLTAMYIVVMLLGFFELYRTFRFYKWDKKAKQLATAPYVMYFGTFISAVLIIVPVMFLLGDTNPYIPHLFICYSRNYFNCRITFNVLAWTSNG